MRRRGSLAVRSRNKNRGERPVGAARRLEQPLDPGEPRTHAAPLEAVHLIEAPREGGARGRLHSRIGMSWSAGSAGERPGLGSGASGVSASVPYSFWLGTLWGTVSGE